MHYNKEWSEWHYGDCYIRRCGGFITVRRYIVWNERTGQEHEVYRLRDVKAIAEAEMAA